MIRYDTLTLDAEVRYVRLDKFDVVRIEQFIVPPSWMFWRKARWEPVGDYLRHFEWDSKDQAYLWLINQRRKWRKHDGVVEARRAGAWKEI